MSTPLDVLAPLAARQAVIELSLELGALHSLHQHQSTDHMRLDHHLQRARAYQQVIAHTLSDHLKTLNDTHSAFQAMLQCLRKLEDDQLIASQVRVLFEPFEQQINRAVQGLEAMV
ncbi:hypothetical protein HZU77_002335 [Neisseriaceae bacterium TC5R-5]|nr:hypothetical protein [Neisseriaceae bacterium TC5R-5]